MKIKLLFLYGPLGGGGAERVLIDFLSNLDIDKYELDLCLMMEEGILLPEVPKYVNIIPLWNSYSIYYKLALRLSKWGVSNYLFQRILEKKLDNKYDVEISFLEGMPLKLHALMKTKAKKITWVHCDLFNFHYTKNQFWKNEEVEAYNKMDNIICVSKDTLRTFVQRFPTCVAEKKVIYNPIDIEKIQKLANLDVVTNDNKFTVVSVGRLTSQKKPERVVHLAAKLKKEGLNVQFQIIGEGELKEELINLVKNLDVADCIEFKGFIRNPYPYIKTAHLMLLSSGVEGFGLVICEAMCLGTPVVSTKTAGPVEIIENNEYGLLCEHDDEAIYKAVKSMIKNQELRKRYQEVGLKRAKMYNVENAITNFDKMINNLLV
jgi:glycosyltransferase involved in cell wall biosynthesis